MKKTAIENMKEKEFENKINGIIANGSHWKDCAKWGKELGEDCQYAIVCMDSTMYGIYAQMKRRLDYWVIENLSEDDACSYFMYLD